MFRSLFGLLARQFNLFYLPLLRLVLPLTSTIRRAEQYTSFFMSEQTLSRGAQVPPAV